MRVLLVGPDHEDNLSIRYLSAALRARGHVAELARFNTSDDHDTVIAESAAYDVVGLSMCVQWRALEFLALADGLRKAGCAMVVMSGARFPTWGQHCRLGLRAGCRWRAVHFQRRAPP